MYKNSSKVKERVTKLEEESTYYVEIWYLSLPECMHKPHKRGMK